MNKQEFEAMVRAREFINMSTTEKQAVVGDVTQYLRSNTPYRNDRALIQLLGEIGGLEAGPDNNKKLDELADFFVKEASRLASPNKEYKPYGEYGNDDVLNKRSVRINRDIDSIADADQYNPLIRKGVDFLKAPERDIARLTKIRGDGNCYFRSISTGFLQKAFTSEPATREASLKHFAGLIREQLVNPNDGRSVYYVKPEGDDPRSLAVKQKEQGELLLWLTDKLDAMANGTDPQARSMQGLYDLFENDSFDVALMIAARALLAHKASPLLNGNEDVMATYPVIYGSIDAYISQQILRMGVCMEGDPVKWDLLASALGSETDIWILERDKQEPISSIKRESPAAATAAGPNFWPNNTLTLLLRPGHYDLLETRADYAHRRQVEQTGRLPQAPATAASANVEDESLQPKATKVSKNSQMGAGATKQAADIPHEKAAILVKPKEMRGVTFNAWQQIKQLSEHSFTDDSLSTARILLEDAMSSERDIKINGESLNDLISKMAAKVRQQAPVPTSSGITPATAASYDDGAYQGKACQSSHQKMNAALGGARAPQQYLGTKAQELRQMLLDAKQYYLDAGEIESLHSVFKEVGASFEKDLKAISATERAMHIEGGASINDLFAEIQDAVHSYANIAAAGPVEEAPQPNAVAPALGEAVLAIWNMLNSFDAETIEAVRDSIESNLVNSTTFEERATKHQGVSINDLIRDRHPCLLDKLEALNEASQDGEIYNLGQNGP